jgi:hypothetical protein
VWYSYIELDIPQWNLKGLNATKRKYIVAHEMGHTLGLLHHDGTLMQSPGFPSPIPIGPTSTDYGAKPPCSGTYSTNGVRCVFNFPN